MGLGDFLDSIGNAVESGFDDVVDGAKHAVGTVVDDGSHLLGDGLNALGFHGAAQDVDNFGDSVADHLGDQVAEKELGQTTDPTQLIHGDVGAIHTTGSRLQTFSTAFGETSQGLSSIDTDHWQGQAADAFRAQYQQHPQQWSNAAEACGTAASAWNNYGDTVSSAQGQAQKAINLYQQGTQATQQAQARYNQAVATFQQQATAYNAAASAGQDPGPMPQAPATFTDPGAADRAQAQQILTTARQQRDTAGSQAQQAMADAADKFPAIPTFTQRMGDDIDDGLTAMTVEGEHFVGGVAKSVGNIGKFVRGIDPLDPYNATHPADYVDHMSQTAAGLVHLALHPQQIVTGMIGSGSSWSSDPAQALGELIPNVIAAVGTDGAGAAADGVEVAGTAAEAADAAGTAMRGADSAATAGSDAAEGLGPADSGAHSMEPTPASAQPAAQAMTDTTGPAAGWGDFGPQGSPDLQAADGAAAGQIDSAGSGLSNIQARLNDLDAHIHPNEATSPSMATESPLAPVHQAPVLHAPSAATDLSAADGAAAQGFGAAGDGLGAAEQDLAGLHVHDPGGSPGPEVGSGYGDPGPDLPTTRSGAPGRGSQGSGEPLLPTERPPMASTWETADPARLRADMGGSATHPDLDLDGLDPGTQWRTSNEPLYRLDGRHPLDDGIFDGGFTPRNPDGSLDVGSHTGATTNSPYVSTTNNPAFYREANGNWYYDIDAPGGVNANQTLDSHFYQTENEISMLGGVQPERIRGAWQVEIDPYGVRQLTNYLPNPNYIPFPW